jgi:hypothetical protein
MRFDPVCQRTSPRVLALVGLAFIMVVSISVAFTVVQPCAVEWR